jgi:hypothetical protein
VWLDTGRHGILYLFHGMSAFFHLMSLPTAMAPCTDKNWVWFHLKTDQTRYNNVSILLL